jgi:hypothetical protein
VKGYPAVALLFALLVLGLGCASPAWMGEVTDDPRLRDCIENAEPLPLTIAVAPVTQAAPPDAQLDEAEERHPADFEPEKLRLSLVRSLEKMRIFSHAGYLQVPQSPAGEPSALLAAWDDDYDLLLNLDFKESEVFYDGVNGLYIPNILNWLFLLVPSWWVKDEVYGARISMDASVTSVRSGRQVASKELRVEFKRNLNDFQRGWQLFGIFRVPGSLGDSNWRRISDHVLPGAIHEVQVQTALWLHDEFKEVSSRPEFNELLRTKLGLVIGVSRHKDYGIPKLRYAEEDAISFHNYLTDPDGGAVPSRNVTLLTNEHASRAKILDRLYYLARKARSEDTVVVYFAGYGAAAARSNGTDETQEVAAESYLVPYDAQLNDIPGTCLSMKRIEEALAGIHAREVVVIFDTSFGGSIGERGLAGSAGPEPLLLSFVATPGRCLLLSGKPGESAMEVEDYRHGVFTFYVLEGLRGPADGNKDGLTTLAELHEYLAGKVPEETEMEGNAQHPQLSGADAPSIVLKGER